MGRPEGDRQPQGSKEVLGVIARAGPDLQIKADCYYSMAPEYGNVRRTTSNTGITPRIKKETFILLPTLKVEAQVASVAVTDLGSRVLKFKRSLTLS